MTASKKPNLFTSSASFIVSAIELKSPVSTDSASGMAFSACSALSLFLACNTTWLPALINKSAAICPRPSAEPVIKILDINFFLDNRIKNEMVGYKLI